MAPGNCFPEVQSVLAFYLSFSLDKVTAQTDTPRPQLQNAQGVSKQLAVETGEGKRVLHSLR